MYASLPTLLWEGQTGYAFIGRKSPNGSWHERAYKYPNQVKVLLNEVEAWNQDGNNVYFCPHLFIDTVRQKKYAKALNVLYADLDSVAPEKLEDPFRPSLLWKTSEGRYAAIWLLNELHDPKEVEDINRRLSYFIGADKGGWDLTQYLRWPGSINYKYDPPHQGEVSWVYPDQVYSLGFFDTSLPIFDVPSNTDELNPTRPDEIPNAVLKLANRIPQKLLGLLRSVPLEDDDWSDTLWRLECQLVEAGFNRSEIFSLVKQSLWNKYARDNRGDLPLIREIDKAMATVVIKPDKEEEPTLQRIEFLTLDQVLASTDTTSWLVQDAWMESNVGWIAGVGKNFKSTISLDLALSIAAGVPFLGKFPVLRPGPVLMIQEEDPMYRVRRRLAAMVKGKRIAAEAGKMGWSEDRKKYSITYTPPSEVPLHLAISQGFSFTDKEKLEQLEESIDLIRPRMVVLDPFYMMAVGVDEYKAGEITAIFNEIKRMRNRYGCAFAIVHHFKKGAGAPSERLYGSMAFYAFSENTFWVTRTGQIVTIERDIKDAMFENAISLEMVAIDEDYIINVQDGQTVIHDIISLLLAEGVGNPLLVADVVKMTGSKRYEVSRAIDELVEKGAVILDASGRGGAKRITSTPTIKQYTPEL